MQSHVIVRSETNGSPEEAINGAIAKLGKGWRVVSAETDVQIFGVRPGTESEAASIGARGPLHHCKYTTTVVMQKD